MKRLLLLTFLCFCTIQGFSNGMFGIYGGAGLSTRYNYDLGLNYGIMGYRAISYRAGLGASIFSQTYNMYYDKESNQTVGTSIRNKSTYGFFSPLLIFDMRRYDGRYKFYVTGGVGYNIGGYDTLHKWNNSGIIGSSYDSVIDGSKNINKLVYRIGFGLMQFSSMGKHLTFCFNEDIGFLPALLSSTTNAADDRLKNNVSRFYKPTYITLRLGIFLR